MKLALLFLMAGVGCLGQTAKQVGPLQDRQYHRADGSACRADDLLRGDYVCVPAPETVIEKRIKALEDRVKVLEEQTTRMRGISEKQDSCQTGWRDYGNGCRPDVPLLVMPKKSHAVSTVEQRRK